MDSGWNSWAQTLCQSFTQSYLMGHIAELFARQDRVEPNEPVANVCPLPSPLELLQHCSDLFAKLI